MPAPDPGRAIDWVFPDTAERIAAAGAPVRRLRARYTRPFLLHGSIGPSCAAALPRDGMLTVWTHTQGAAARSAVAAGLNAAADQRRSGSA